MFRTMEDFFAQWGHEAQSTGKVLAALTDASLAQPVVAGGRTLGFLAWHLTVAIPVQMAQLGLRVEGPAPDAPVPTRASAIAEAYGATARALAEQLRGAPDARLLEIVDYYGMRIPVGLALDLMIRHQTHHRGQMTVLMRQAGLPVPGVYGPSREEWAALGRPALA